MKRVEGDVFFGSDPDWGMRIGDSLKFFSDELAYFTDDPALEARLIIQQVTGLSRPVLLSHPERELSDSEVSRIRELCGRRKEGFPLPYLLGEWEFYGRSFFVDPSVLIPRPETELLVEKASAFLKSHLDINFVYDIGTGSGCIAISLLCEFSGLKAAAVDLHKDALLTACRNADRHGVRDRFVPVQADLFSAFASTPYLLCANLPYIPSETCKTIEPARFEPLSALDGGRDGFEFYRLLFQQIQHKIVDESLILCEIEYRQRELALQTASEFFPECRIEVLDDLAGQPRILEIVG